MRKLRFACWGFSIAVFLALFFLCIPALAQSGGTDHPIDLLIVLDNSCSMFPKEWLIPGCTWYGSDVNFLRITGADMFLARLGFDQAHEADYQIGVVSLGDEPTLVSPLRPLADQRDSLAGLIANPKPEKATRIVPAMQMAFDELTTSPNRKETNLPAVVLITDGVPNPPQGQSNADIENLIQKYPDIPLFLMILKGTDSNVDEFDEYVKFWQDMQQKYDHVFVYVIEQADQIQNTYNTIVASLQDAIPTKGSLVVPGEDLPFYVSQYVDKVVITVSFPPGARRGSVQVIDPGGQVVQDGEAGVAHFSGKQNPVEIISIGTPRLAEAYKDQYWTIQADSAANVFIDHIGAYHIQVLFPEVVSKGLENVYLVQESQTPRQEFVLRFSLLDSNAKPVLDPQPVWVEVLPPDGEQNQIPVAAETKPDESGVYELHIDLPAIYPYVGSKFERFVFVIHAGSAGEHPQDAIPIATARLLVDIGPSPFIQLLNPAKIECSQGAAQKIQLTIGDVQSVIPETLSAIVSSPAGEVLLTGQDGDLRGDLTGLCQGLLSQFSCGQVAENVYTLKIDAKLQDDHPFQAIERSIPVQVIAPECTPSPTQVEAAFVLPTPRPTPVPDEDGDGFVDPVDSCPVLPGNGLFGGCPAPVWAWIGGVIVSLGFIGVLAVFVWPPLSVRYLSPPPDVYIAICNRDATLPVIYSVREMGVKRRSNRVKIGGDSKKADIYVPGLKPVEFTVDDRGDRIVLADAFKGEARAVFRQLSAEKVATSNPGIRLCVAAKRNALDGVTY